MSALAAPGSILWLLGHELRLAWRSIWSSAKGKRRLIWLSVAAVFALIAAFGLGVPFALAIRRWSVEASPLFDAGVAVGMLVILSLMIAQALNAATLVLYERRDLDLLLSSPLPASRILTVRALAITLSCVALFTVLASPFAISLAIVGRPQWLAIYPVLASLALAATAIGLSLCMGLFALVGPRTTRVIAQILAGVIGAAFFLTSQAGRLVPKSRAQAVYERAQEAAASGWFDPGQAGSWPARALLAEPLPLLTLTLVGVVLFVLAVSVLGRRFAADAAAAAGAGSGANRRADPSAPMRGFSRAGLFQIMVGKELRLLRRDPWLISQVLLQVLYLVGGLGVAGYQIGNRHAQWIGPGAAASLTFLTAQLAGNLAWITVSAEDAPELLSSSPVSKSQTDRAKAFAAILPVALLMAGPVAALTWFAPMAGVAALVGVACSATSSALLNIWWQRPGKRRDIRRGRRSSWVVSIAETVLAACWAGAAVLLAYLQPWCLIPAGVAVGLIVVMRQLKPAAVTA